MKNSFGDMDIQDISDHSEINVLHKLIVAADYL